MHIVIRITANDRGNPPGKLADAELHFIDGELDGLKLVGFTIWERPGQGLALTVPALGFRRSRDRTIREWRR